MTCCEKLHEQHDRVFDSFSYCLCTVGMNNDILCQDIHSSQLEIKIYYTYIV